MNINTVEVTIENVPTISDLKVIAIKGTVDAVTSKYLDEKILPMIEEGKSNIILDLSRIDYLSSTGMMCLIKYLVFSTDKKRILRLIKPSKSVYDTLLIAGIAKHFEIYDSIEAALVAFK
jgi:anti-sigma B factor antagonist